jgi:hypothetical protein
LINNFHGFTCGKFLSGKVAGVRITVFAAKITFVGKVPHYEEGRMNQEWTAHAEVDEAGYYALYGSPAVGVS